MRRPARYANISTATTTVLKGATATDPKGGRLYAIVVNNPGATATITVYENNAASGSVIATIGGLTGPVTLTYDILLNAGLTIVTAGGTPPNITVCFE